jgi:predicted GNAT family N-acyltransferase
MFSARAEKQTMEMEIESGAPAEEAQCVRRRVFCEEQGIDESVEIDGLDEISSTVHVVARDRASAEAVGAARGRPLPNKAVKAERVCVLQSYRKRSVGSKVMRALDAHFASLGCEQVIVHAQESVVEWYKHLGYSLSSYAPVVEANITHLVMAKPCLLSGGDERTEGNAEH